MTTETALCEKVILICDECASEWSCDCDEQRVQVCASCYQAPDACQCWECRQTYWDAMMKASE